MAMVVTNVAYQAGKGGADGERELRIERRLVDTYSMVHIHAQRAVN